MFCRIWQEGTGYLLSKILSALPRSFSNSFNTSCHANCCPKTESFSRASLPGVFWHQISTSSHGDLPPENWYSLSLVPLTKRVLLPALRLRPIIWRLSSSSTPLPCYSFRLLYDLYIPFSVQPVTGCRHPLAFILNWIRYFVQLAGRGVDIHSYSYSSHGQFLGPVNSNTEG